MIAAEGKQREAGEIPSKLGVVGRGDSLFSLDDGCLGRKGFGWPMKWDGRPLSLVALLA